MLFVKYLRYLKEENPALFTASATAVAAGQLVHIFDHFLIRDLLLLPFDSSKLEMLAQCLQDFLCDESLDVSPFSGDFEINENDKLRAHIKNVKNNPKIKKFIRAMINIACEELLTEQAAIQPEIIELLGLADLMQSREGSDLNVIRANLVASFITEIIMGLVLQKWCGTESYINNMITRMDVGRLARRIFVMTKQSLLQEGPPDHSSVELLTRIWNTPGNFQKIIQVPAQMATKINTLVSAAIDEESTWLSRQIFPQDDEQRKKKLHGLIQWAFKSETDKALTSTFRFVLKTVNYVLPDIVKEKLGDYVKYGKALVDDFDQHTYIDFIKVNTAKVNDFPVIFSHEAKVSPFSEWVILELAQYFHELLLQSGATDSVNISQTQLFKNVLAKMVFYAYAQILDAQGNIKPELVVILKRDNRDLVIDEQQRAELISSYLRSLLISAFNYWLNLPGFQIEFSNSKLPLMAINKLISAIEASLAEGLNKQFLQELNVFPIFGDASLADRFAIPLTVATSKGTSVGLVIDDIRRKLRFVNEKIATNEIFMQEKITEFARLQRMADDVNTRVTVYEESMGIFFNSFDDSVFALRKLKQFQQLVVDDMPKIAGDFDSARDFVRLLKNQCLRSSIKEIIGFCSHVTDRQIEIKRLLVSQKKLLSDSEKLVADWLEHRSRILAIQYFLAELEGLVATTATLIKTEKKKAFLAKYEYELRDRVIMCSAYSNQLQEEVENIVAAESKLKNCFADIRNFCGGFKIACLEKLISRSVDQLRVDLGATLTEIVSQKRILQTNTYRINVVVDKFMERKQAVAPLLREVFNLFNFILTQNDPLWSHAIGYFFGGGENFFIGTSRFVFPKRVVAMRIALQIQDPALEYDLKIIELWQAFKNTMPGWSFRRSDEARELNNIMGLLDSLIKSDMFYSENGLLELITKQQKFLNDCPTKYNMTERYHSTQVKIPTAPVPDEPQYGSMYGVR
jgi:hypothetical protein